MRGRKIIMYALPLLILGGCKDCVDCTGVAAGTSTNKKICKGDYDTKSQGVSWASFKSSLIINGCKDQ